MRSESAQTWGAMGERMAVAISPGACGGMGGEGEENG